jgi:hypothetical protein
MLLLQMGLEFSQISLKLLQKWLIAFPQPQGSYKLLSNAIWDLQSGVLKPTEGLAQISPRL